MIREKCGLKIFNNLHFHFLIILFCIVTQLPACAQTDSIVFVPNSIVFNNSAKRKPFIKQMAVPASLVLAGVLFNRRQFEKNLNKNVRNTVGDNFHTKVDDYLRYAPIAELYAADAVGIKAKNHWFDQTKNLAISFFVTDFITYRIKKLAQKSRPNGSAVAHSFPSSHSSVAFANATVLYEEFREINPSFAYTGYGFAVATGSLRLANNAHWLSDVLVGAAIGITVTKVVYLLDPIIKWNPFKDSENIIVVPTAGRDGYGLYVCKRF
jgi:membrane-associated phospholipid phosphatase